MLVFAPKFIAVPKHPGYLWEPDEEMLYSFKSGVVKALTFNRATFFNHYHDSFCISTKGRQTNISVTYLRTLKSPSSPEYVKVEHENN